MTWRPHTVLYASAARKDLADSDQPLQARIVAAIDRYAATGYGDVKRLQGVDREWRLRVGDWRVRFTLDGAVLVVTVLRVLPRGGAYL